VEQARKKIGLCPQINPLLDLMTGRETLAMYARIRGIPLRHINDEVQNLLDRLTLTPHADKITETYSGGNKRKLSLGISLVSSPAVLLIDESSSGIDPSASRKIWDLISDVSQGRSVLLTTHSMDEAQALSTKTGIMASGQLLCLGSVQHLKVSSFLLMSVGFPFFSMPHILNSSGFTFFLIQDKIFGWVHYRHFSRAVR
jgi:ATP-binding cassette subfamily A (ABC1) protein 3